MWSFVRSLCPESLKRVNIIKGMTTKFRKKSCLLCEGTYWVNGSTFYFTAVLFFAICCQIQFSAATFQIWISLVHNIFFIYFFYCFCPFLFYILFTNLVLINRRNRPRYQRVLALCTFFFLTGAIPKGLILWKFCVSCFCIFCFIWVCVRTDFVVFG